MVERRAELRAATNTYEATEERLRAWGRERRRAAASTIAVMIDRVKVFEQQTKGVRMNAVRKVKGKRPWDVDAKVAAEEFGYVEPHDTAKGKQTESFGPSANIAFSSGVLQVEAIVQRLPGAMKPYIYRAYLYGQPDRLMAKDMQLEREYVTLRRRAAVAYVAEKLAGRTWDAL